jgi:hypothetical protein
MRHFLPDSAEEHRVIATLQAPTPWPVSRSWPLATRALQAAASSRRSTPYHRLVRQAWAESSSCQ